MTANWDMVPRFSFVEVIIHISYYEYIFKNFMDNSLFSGLLSFEGAEYQRHYACFFAGGEKPKCYA